MRLAFGFAGVPPQVFDAFRRGQSKLVEVGDLVIAESFKGVDAGYYANPHAHFFLKQFAELLRNDNQNELAEVGFAVAYVSTHPGAQDFSERLFPAILTIPIEWRLTGYNRTTWGRSLTDLNEQFRQAVIKARAAIPALKKELIEQDNRTPWLLPPKNFRSGALVPALRSLHDSMRGSNDVRTELQGLRRAFEHSHPPQRIDSKQRRCFVDDAGIEFHPPGAARHAFARTNYDGHPPACLVRGRRRLGSPYDRAFHYDCASGDGVLRATLWNCHADPAKFAGSPHINIAPNDFVRA